MDSLMQLGLAINLLAQIPQATLSATKLYSKHPYLACFMFAAVLLVLLAFKVRGGTDGWSGARLQELVVSAADRALERGLAAGVASSVGMADFVGLVPGPPPSPPPACSQVGCWSARFGC